MFGTTNIVKHSDKDNWVYSRYGIAFDGGDCWSFGNGTARSVIIFGVDNSSSPYVGNLKNHFLILGKGPTFGNNGLILPKQIQYFAWVNIIMIIIVICLLMEKK